MNDQARNKVSRVFRAALIGFFVAMGTSLADHYFLAFMEHGQPSNKAQLKLAVVNNDVTSGIVTAWGVGRTSWLLTEISVTAGGSFYLDLKNNFIIVNQDYGHRNSIQISCSLNLTIYAFYEDFGSSDGFLVSKLSDLATEYYVITSCAYSATLGSSCQFLIVTTSETSTMLTFSMPKWPVYFWFNSISGRTNFSAGEVVSMEVTDKKSLRFSSYDDLTGLRLTAGQPIALTAGNTYGRLDSTAIIDYNEAEMFPVQAWGNVHPFITVTLSDQVLIMTSQTNTTIQLFSVGVVCDEYFIFDSGEYLILSASYSHNLILSDKPVAVVHFPVLQDGTHSMHTVMPLEQYKQRVSFFVPSSASVVMVTHTNMTESVTLDGLSLLNGTISWVPIPKSKFSAASIEVSAGVAHVVKQSGDGGIIGGYVYGTNTSTGSFSIPLPGKMNDLLTGCGGVTCLSDSTKNRNISSSTASPSVTNSTNPPTNTINTSTTASTTASTSSSTTSTTASTTSTTASTTSSTTSSTSSTTSSTSSSTTTQTQTTAGATTSTTTSTVIHPTFTTRPIPVIPLSEVLKSSTSQSPVGSCMCDCNSLNIPTSAEGEPLSPDEKEEEFSRVIAEMTVEPSSLSSHERQLTSAEDKRPSAKAVGATCAVCVFSLCSIIVIIDAASLIKGCMACKRKIRYQTGNAIGAPQRICANDIVEENGDAAEEESCNV